MKCVEIERAGTSNLQILLMRQRDEIRARSAQVANRVPKAKAITEDERAYLTELAIQRGALNLI